MKKLILAMVSILLIALFIAFNYLLWDRENRVKELDALEAQNANNSADMNLRNREIKSLEDENSALQLKITQLQDGQELLKKNGDALAQEKDRLDRLVSSKNEVVNALKAIGDIKVFEEPVKKWVDAINAGEYDKAYQYEYGGVSGGGSTPGVDQYTENLKSTVKSMALKSVKLDAARGTAEGEIYLEVELEVKLVDKTVSKGYNDGVNQRYVKIGYEPYKKEFMILQITLY